MLPVITSLIPEAGRIYEAREAYSEALHLSPPAGEAGSEPSKDVRVVLFEALLTRIEMGDCFKMSSRWDPRYLRSVCFF